MTASLHALRIPGNGWRNAHRIADDHDREVSEQETRAYEIFRPRFQCKNKRGCITPNECEQFKSCLSP